MFVHGFLGKAEKSWQRFPENREAWWQESDLLFVGYDSTHENITGVAAQLRRELPNFYPLLPARHLTAGGFSARPGPPSPYQALLIVGHSLGGLVVRRALCDVAVDWQRQQRHNPGGDRPSLLDAEVRLFSPASAGFRPAGALGMLHAIPGWWSMVSVFLRRSSAYTDLQPGASILTSTKQMTEAAVSADVQNLGALQPAIVWANPDNVVIADRYLTDPVDDAINQTDHVSVCKPDQNYPTPWTFVRTGKI